MSVTIAKEKYPAFAAGTGVSGKRLVLFVNYGTGATEDNPVWNLVGGLTSNTLSLSAEATTNQTKDNGYWPISAITSKSYEVDAEVIMMRDNVAQEAIEAFMIDDEITAEKQLLHIALVDLDTTDYYELKVAPTSWEITAESEDMITKSFTASGSGAPEKKTGFVVPGEDAELPGMTYSKTDDQDLVISLPSSTITGLKDKDGVAVDAADYSIAAGDHALIILSSYLTTLSNGDYKFFIVLSDSSEVSVVITVGA